MNICVDDPSTTGRGDSGARERVDLVLSQLDHLPTMPAVVNRLLAATTSGSSNVRDVVEIIEVDPALTALVLRMVSRSDVGVRTDGITVQRAVSALGFAAVRNAVLAVKVFECFFDPKAEPEIADHCRAVWMHMVAVGCTCELLCKESRQRDRAPDAFVAGLLHDVGKVALLACMPKAYARVVRTAEERGICICDAEIEAFGMDHTVAGKHLTSSWGLPRAVVECSWLHHQAPEGLPSTVSDKFLVGLVHASDELVRLRGLGYSGFTSRTSFSARTAESRLDDALVAKVMKALPARIDPIVEMFDMSGPGAESISTEALFEANRRLSRTNAKLIEENQTIQSGLRVLDCLHNFYEASTHAESVADVCEACVGAMRQLLSSDGAVLYWGEDQGRSVHAAVQHPDRDQGERLFVEVGDLGEVSDVYTQSFGAFVPAKDLDVSVWTRCGLKDGVRPKWRLPLACGPGIVAALVVATDESQVKILAARGRDVEGLSLAFGAAIASARKRSESDRTTEELISLNRKLRNAQDELLHMRSVSMTAAMAAGAAHELNNPLSVISGRAQLELDGCDDPARAKGLQTIVDQTRRASDIVSELMSFAKPNAPEPMVLPLAELLEMRRQHCQSGFGLAADQIAVTLTDPEVRVYADPLHLRAILDAVIQNAVEAARSESVRIKINSPSRLTDETVRIVVEDNGPGMSREVLAHALDPFFSDRPAGRGRGLGLSRAYRLAEINKGRLRIDSAPGHGTKVMLTFPPRA